MGSKLWQLSVNLARSDDVSRVPEEATDPLRGSKGCERNRKAAFETPRKASQKATWQYLSFTNCCRDDGAV